MSPSSPKGSSEERFTCSGSKHVGEGEEPDEGEDQVKRKHAPQSNVVNYYFTNFPPEWNEAYLRKVFAEVGELVDVYVARKISKAGSRFGFARFLQDGNPKVLEKKLNQIRYGSFKLRANIAKFERFSSKFRPDFKKAFFSNWLEKAQVGESILIHSPSQLLSMFGVSNVTNCKVENLGGMRILIEFRNKEGGCKTSSDSLNSEKSAEEACEKVKHTFDHRSDTTDITDKNNVEGGFNSNSGDVSNDIPTEADAKHMELKPGDGKGDKYILDNPARGVSGLIFSNDDDQNCGDDGSGDGEELVSEKVAPDVDISEPKAVVTDPTFEKVITGQKKLSNLNKKVVTGEKKYSNLNVFKGHMGYFKSEVKAPCGPRSLEKFSKYKHHSFNNLMSPRKKKKVP